MKKCIICGKQIAGYETKQECTTADSVTICRDVKYGKWYVKDTK